ncbi:ThiF family adenylyltransferase [Nocardioides terrisoli]|uniref:ThiF family adenylyltransferase n=1 Tax=Nocardioides terrisoli TaxID=3388267 RepID=UPI00287B5E64|nr:ThiF family adenylyltransferase [Nocardioides marmorisolisilvae]
MSGIRPPVESVELRFRGADWDRLVGHLFPGDSDEHGAALLCGQAQVGTRLTLVVREVVPAQDGRDYLPGTRGYRLLDGAFVTRQLRAAHDAGLVYLAAHNHGGSDRVGFSGSDLASHERGYPTLLAINGSPVGGLVLAKNAIAGDIWLTDGRRLPLYVTTVVGEGLTRLTDGDSRESDSATEQILERYERQALIFGPAGQSILSNLRVGVVGAGGVGMLVVQALSRLGVGEFVLIDPDHVSVTNLPRLPEARLSDAIGHWGNGPFGRLARRFGRNQPTSKVRLAARVIHGANPDARITAIRGDVADDSIARSLIGCDFIFLAADTMLSREVVNQIAYQYLVPTLQVGSKVVIDSASGDVLDVFGAVRALGTAPGCLRCNDLINMSKLAEESVASVEQRQNQRYVDEPGIDAPSVITLNAMAVGIAVNDFMQFATGLGRPASGYRIIRSKPVAAGQPQLVVQQPHIDPECHVCGLRSYSVLSVGDASELPTRIR